MNRRVWILCLIALVLPTMKGLADEQWKKVLSLGGNWKFSIGDNRRWAAAEYDDSDWETLRVPGNWEDQGFHGFNGYAWYRRTFDGSLLQGGVASYYLFLGFIDDVDEVYVNGQLVGSSGSFPPRYRTAYNSERRYLIPTEYLKLNGRNVVSVRVYDAEIEGGIVSGNIGIYQNENDQSLVINLRGVWDFALGERKTFSSEADPASFKIKRTPPDNAGWVRMMVPAWWEHQGYDRYDGTAWYRKQFYVPKSLEGEDLVLLLGKIDDYDQAYVNGQLVGSTTKYDHLRVYHLSSDALKAGAYNIIWVYTYDYGGMGGIYEGPVGFMKQSQFTRFMRYRD